MQTLCNIMDRALGDRKDLFSSNCERLVKTTQQVACSLILLGNVARIQSCMIRVILLLSSSCMFAFGMSSFSVSLNKMNLTPQHPDCIQALFRFLQNNNWLQKGIYWASVGIKVIVACVALISCLLGSSSFSFFSLFLLLIWTILHVVFDLYSDLLHTEKKQMFSCLLFMLTSLLSIWFLGFLAVPLLPS